jgi:hypothetical protein
MGGMKSDIDSECESAVRDFTLWLAKQINKE